MIVFKWQNNYNHYEIFLGVLAPPPPITSLNTPLIIYYIKKPSFVVGSVLIIGCTICHKTLQVSQTRMAIVVTPANNSKWNAEKYCLVVKCLITHFKYFITVYTEKSDIVSVPYELWIMILIMLIMGRSHKYFHFRHVNYHAEINSFLISFNWMETIMSVDFDLAIKTHSMMLCITAV